MNESVRNHQGREYVTITEFAYRVGCTRMTVHNRIKAGVLQGIHIDRTRELWLDWETQHRQWLLCQKSSGRKVGKPAKKKASGKTGRKKTTTEMATIKSLKPAAARLPSAPSIEAEEKIPKGEDLVDLSRINPEDHKDCWLLEDGKPVINPLTKEPTLDYDMLKLKLVAQKYQLDLDEKRGKLVEKEELSRSMLAISHVIIAALNSIPQRYEALLTAKAESISGYSFTPKERAEIRDVLKNEAAAITGSISRELEKIMGE